MKHSLRRTPAHALSFFSVTLLAALGCNQADPEDDTEPEPSASGPGPAVTPGPTDPTVAPSNEPDPSGTEPAPTEPGPSATAPDPQPMGNDTLYFPLYDGGEWTYTHHTLDGDWDERITMTADTYEGRPVFKVEDTPDPGGVVDIQYWEKIGTRTLRIHRDEYDNGSLSQRVDYVPGFLRFDEAWKLGAIDLATYERTATDSSGIVTVEQREQRYIVIETDASVTVPAGSYDGCMVIDRERDDVGDHSRFWYARGVGKVREENLDNGNTEELTGFSAGK